jgi:hypothetical protein
MVVDVAVQWVGWRESSHLLRLLTGSVGGVGLAELIVREPMGAPPIVHSGATRVSRLSRSRAMWLSGSLLLVLAGVPDPMVRAGTTSEIFPDRATCEQFAHFAAESAPQQQVQTAALADAAKRDPRVCLIAPVILPVEGASVAARNRRQRQEAYEQAVQDCLEPSRLAERLGSENLAVAESLHTLANRFSRATALYSDAERLYRHVLVIRLERQGPEHLDVAATLEDYARLLQRAGRETEAAELNARAQGIRGRRGQ